MIRRTLVPYDRPAEPDWGPFIAEDIVTRRLLYRMSPAHMSDWAMTWFPWATAEQIGRGVAIAAELTVAECQLAKER